MKLCYLIIVAVGIPAAISSRQRVVHTPIIKATKRSTYANASIDLSLEDSQVIEELVWSINMTVGVPRQNFTAVLDTSTSDLFIPDLKSNLCLSSNQSTCNINSVACDPAEICNGSEVIPSSYFGGFDPSSSSTLTLLNHLSGFHATYNGGDSQVNGTFALDDISIHGLNVEQAEFVVAEEASGVLPVRATWGIGFENYQADHNAIEIYPSILRKMKDQAIISCMLFSLYPNSYDLPGASITFGGIDTAKFDGDLHTVPLISDNKAGIIDQYLVPWTSFEIGNSKYANTTSFQINHAALFDTSTVDIQFPPDLAASLSSPLGFIDGQGNGIDCDFAQSGFFFRFGFNNDPSAVITVNASDIVKPSLGVAANNTCYKPWSVSQNNMAVFGLAFLGAVYTVYDHEHLQIGLAQAKSNVTETNIVECDGTTGIPSAVPLAPTASFTAVFSENGRLPAATPIMATPASISSSPIPTGSSSSSPGVSTTANPNKAPLARENLLSIMLMAIPSVISCAPLFVRIPIVL